MKHFAILPLFALAACATTDPDPGQPISTPVLGENDCDAEALGYLVGQDFAEVDHETLPRPYRAIRPGMAVTMDYREDRTNFDLDENDRVLRVYCG